MDSISLADAGRYSLGTYYPVYGVHILYEDGWSGQSGQVVSDFFLLPDSPSRTDSYY